MEPKNAVKPKSEERKDDPKAKARKGFSRREALKAGLLALGGVALSKCSSEYKPNGNDGGMDGSTHDASGLDANVSLDASMMDTGVHDASIRDASINDAAPDAAIGCAPFDEQVTHQNIPINGSHEVGGYSILYKAFVNIGSFSLEVRCAGDDSLVVAEQTYQSDQEYTMPLNNGKQLRLNIWGGSSNLVVVDATVETSQI